MAAPYELRPLTFGELLDRAFTIYRRDFLVLAGIMLTATLLPGLLAVAAMAIIGTHPVAGLIVMCVYFPLGVIGYAAATAATTHAVSAALMGEPFSMGSSFEAVKSRIGPVLGGSILMGLGILVGFLLLVVPGVIALLRWFVLVPTLVLERGSVDGALRRSWNLTDGHMGRIFGIFLLIMCIGFAVGMLVVLPFTALMIFASPGTAGSGFSQAVMQLLQYGANVLVLPVQSIITVLIYYDLRVRKEAFDVERMMSGMGGTPPPVAPPLG